MKSSFFKLPLIFTYAYILSSILISFIYLIGTNGTISTEFIIYRVIYQLFLFKIPNYLLLFFLSAIALNRCHIYQVTTKNVVSLIVISFVIQIIIELFYLFLSNALFDGLMKYSFFEYNFYNYIFYWTFIQIITYSILGIITYFGIVSLRNMFDRCGDFTEFTDRSNKIHLCLFIVLFMFLYTTILQLLSFIFSVYSYNIIIPMYFIIIVITALILYLFVKNTFTQLFSVLQTRSIVISVLVSFIFSVIVNTVISLVTLFMVFSIAFNLYSYDANILIVFLFSTLLQLFFFGLIIRTLTKRYFTIPLNRSTL